MKFLFLLIFSAISLSAVANEVRCFHRLNSNLGITIVVNDPLNPVSGGLSYDDVNTCTSDGFCTEMYAGTFKVMFKNTNPESEDVTEFSIKSVASTNDLGARYNRRSAMGKFVKDVKFEASVNGELNVLMFLRGRTHVMKCSEM